jgi:xanthine dehydrogenase accessory factor
MLVDADGNIEGSVTGGCVEGALVEEAGRVFAGGSPRVVTYGISDEAAGQVGLMCGGTVRILVAELTADVAPAVTAALTAVQSGRPAAIATLLDGPTTGRRLAVVDGDVVGELAVTELLDRSVARDAAGLLEQGVSMIRRYGADGSTMGDDLRVFVRSFATPPRMIIFGAIDFSAALAVLAREAGYKVTICDARKPFLESDRFSHAAEVVNEWPDRYLAGQQLGERDAVLVFTHDAKFDEPALIAALATGAGYIGALGSRRTQEDRRRRLADAGVPEAQLERIVGPCGLDIGASTPMETAVSILAEIIARRTRRSAAPLTETDGTIRARAQLPVS